MSHEENHPQRQIPLDEIYFKEEPGLAGKTFGEALLAYEDSALIGLRFEGSRVQLNPPMATRISPRPGQVVWRQGQSPQVCAGYVFQRRSRDRAG